MAPLTVYRAAVTTPIERLFVFAIAIAIAVTLAFFVIALAWPELLPWFPRGR